MITDLSAEQLRKAATLKGQIVSLEKQLQTLLGNVSDGKVAKGSISPAGRARLSAAAKARWAKVKAAKGTSTQPARAGRKPMSAAARAKISAAAKERWAKIKAAK